MRTIHVLLILSLLYTPLANADEEKTRVRVTGTPQLRFEPFSNGILVKSMEVEIQNVGSVKATGVRVELSIPNGKTLTAKCDSLAPKEKSTCTEKFSNLLMPHFKGTLNAKADCDNCYS